MARWSEGEWERKGRGGAWVYMGDNVGRRGMTPAEEEKERKRKEEMGLAPCHFGKRRERGRRGRGRRSSASVPWRLASARSGGGRVDDDGDDYGGDLERSDDTGRRGRR
uniref:Uncharacterized protein n=1 Tax=Oryza sativa subsp. japonica TaxID=39947 RepID=Q8W332_ORYSJ|nr:hypothetical protein [Oryza sativa Japonica Group]